MALDVGVEIIALFWRCARLWSLEHIVGSSDSVWEQDLIPAVDPMGGPSAAVGGDLKIRAFFHGGTRRVRLKSKAPLSCASAESHGFIIDSRRRFKVRVAWERR